MWDNCYNPCQEEERSHYTWERECLSKAARFIPPGNKQFCTVYDSTKFQYKIKVKEQG